MRYFARRYPNRDSAKKAYDHAVEAIDIIDGDFSFTLSFWKPVGGWICVAIGDSAHPDFLMGGVRIELPHEVVAFLYKRKEEAQVPPGQLHRMKLNPPVAYRIPGGDAHGQ